MMHAYLNTFHILVFLFIDYWLLIIYLSYSCRASAHFAAEEKKKATPSEPRDRLASPTRHVSNEAK
jgi:hypothetical protein